MHLEIGLLEKNYEVALNNVNNSLEIYRDDVYSNFLKIRILIEKDDLNGALNYTNECIKNYPSIADFYFAKGSIFENEKRYTESINCFKKSKTLKFDQNLNPDAMIGLIYRKICSYEESLIYFNKSFKKEPEFGITILKVGTLNELKRYDESLKIIDQVLRRYPDFLEFVLHKGFVLTNKKLFKEAIPFFERVISFEFENSDNILKIHGKDDEELHNDRLPIAYQNLGVCQYNLGKEKEANDSITKSLDFLKTAEDFANLASFFLEIDNFYEAKKYIKKSFEIDSENALSWRVNGDYYAELEKLEKAIECYNKALKFDFDGGYKCHIKKDIEKLEKILKKNKLSNE